MRITRCLIYHYFKVVRVVFLCFGTDEPTDNLQYVLLGYSIEIGLEDDLRECKKVFSDLKLIVIDTLQKVRGTVDKSRSSRDNR